METAPMVQLLLDAGFNNGWAIAGDVLLIWEHDVDPPAPLQRPITPPLGANNDTEQPA